MVSQNIRFAKLVSLLFGAPWITFLIIMMLVKVHLPIKNAQTIRVILLTLQLGFPFAYIVYAYKKGIISSLDMTNRRERIRPLVVGIVSFALSLSITYTIGAVELLNLQIILFVALFINFLVTIFWKISLHMALAVNVAILLNYLFSWQLPYIYLVIPLIFWSRYVLQRHTSAQLIAGFVLNTIIVTGGLYYFGLL